MTHSFTHDIEKDNRDIVSRKSTTHVSLHKNSDSLLSSTNSIQSCNTSDDEIDSATSAIAPIVSTTHSSLDKTESLSSYGSSAIQSCNSDDSNTEMPAPTHTVVYNDFMIPIPAEGNRQSHTKIDSLFTDFIFTVIPPLHCTLLRQHLLPQHNAQAIHTLYNNYYASISQYIKSSLIQKEGYPTIQQMINFIQGREEYISHSPKITIQNIAHSICLYFKNDPDNNALHTRTFFRQTLLPAYHMMNDIISFKQYISDNDLSILEHTRKLISELRLELNSVPLSSYNTVLQSITHTVLPLEIFVIPQNAMVLLPDIGHNLVVVLYNSNNIYVITQVTAQSAIKNCLKKMHQILTRGNTDNTIHAMLYGITITELNIYDKYLILSVYQALQQYNIPIVNCDIFDDSLFNYVLFDSTKVQFIYAHIPSYIDRNALHTALLPCEDSLVTCYTPLLDSSLQDTRNHVCKCLVLHINNHTITFEIPIIINPTLSKILYKHRTLQKITERNLLHVQYMNPSTLSPSQEIQSLYIDTILTPSTKVESIIYIDLIASFPTIIEHYNRLYLYIKNTVHSIVSRHNNVLPHTTPQENISTCLTTIYIQYFYLYIGPNADIYNASLTPIIQKITSYIMQDTHTMPFPETFVQYAHTICTQYEAEFLQNNHDHDKYLITAQLMREYILDKYNLDDDQIIMSRSSNKNVSHQATQMTASNILENKKDHVLQIIENDLRQYYSYTLTLPHTHDNGMQSLIQDAMQDIGI